MSFTSATPVKRKIDDVVNDPINIESEISSSTTKERPFKKVKKEDREDDEMFDTWTQKGLEVSRKMNSVIYDHTKPLRIWNQPGSHVNVGEKDRHYAEMIRKIIDTPHPIGDIPVPVLVLFSEMCHQDEFRKKMKSAFPDKNELNDGNSGIVFNEDRNKYSTPQTHMRKFHEAVEIAQSAGINISDVLSGDMFERIRGLSSAPNRALHDPESIQRLQECSSELSREVVDRLQKEMKEVWESRRRDGESEVIDPDTQTADHAMKRELQALRTTGKARDASQTLTWEGHDADGNPVPFTDHLSSSGIDLSNVDVNRKSLVEMTLLDRRPQNASRGQARISCETKKNVPGVETYIAAVKEMAGIQGSPLDMDCLRGERFNTLYDAMEKHIDGMTYAPIRFIGADEKPIDAAKETMLDFMLRFPVGNIESKVLSDFPAESADAEETVNTLLFVSKVAQRYLASAATREDLGLTGEESRFLKTRSREVGDSVLFMLAESKPSLQNVGNVWSSLVDRMEKAIEGKEDPDAKEILSQFFTSEGKLRLGALSGPSDATSRAGAIAPILLDKVARRAVATQECLKDGRIGELYRQLYGANQPEVPLYSGQGTSERRDANVFIHGFDAVTSQGPSPNVPWLKASSIPGRKATWEPSDDYIDQCADQHAHFWDEENGCISAEWNAIIEANPLAAHLADKIVIGTQGRRGKVGYNIPYKDQRAITASAITSQIGAMSQFLFPMDKATGEVRIEEKKGDFLNTMLADPRGAERVVNQLSQLGKVDVARMRAFGFNRGVEEQGRYLRGMTKALAETLGMEDRFKAGIDGEDYDLKHEFVNQVLNILRSKRNLAPEVYSATCTLPKKLDLIKKDRDAYSERMKFALNPDNIGYEERTVGKLKTLNITDPDHARLLRGLANYSNMILDENTCPAYRVVYSNAKACGPLVQRPNITPLLVAAR